MAGRSVSPFEQYGTATPASDLALTVYVFNMSDTISGLAYRFYGDWTMWRLIAERNQEAIAAGQQIGADVRQIAPGTRLLIPQMPVQTGIYTPA
jgi:nucleoid-associated protein YgaU